MGFFSLRANLHPIDIDLAVTFGLVKVATRAAQHRSLETCRLKVTLSNFDLIKCLACLPDGTFDSFAAVDFLRFLVV